MKKSVINLTQSGIYDGNQKYHAGKEDSRDCERGGLFIIIYVALVVTFGFTLLVTDVAIMIMTYYSVIGGWITEYLAVYLAGQGVYAAEEGYFTSFITSEVYPIIFMLLFLAITAFIVYSGVEKGIERFARIVMPGLLIMIVGIAVYSLTLHFKDGKVTLRYQQNVA